MELLLTKLPNGCLAPADEDAVEWLSKTKTGSAVRAKVSRVRNYPYLQKFHCLVRLAFDIWSETCEPMEYRGQPVTPNVDRFRKELIILAGYYTAHYSTNGEVRLEAKSISFANMSEEEFQTVFSRCIDVVLRKILNGRGITEEQLRRQVDAVLSYA